MEPFMAHGGHYIIIEQMTISENTEMIYIYGPHPSVL